MPKLKPALKITRTPNHWYEYGYSYVGKKGKVRYHLGSPVGNVCAVWNESNSKLVGLYNIETSKWED